MFFLRQEWRDPEDGIETVLLHWTTSRLEQEPNWLRAQQTTVMMPQPATRPGLRACALWVVPPFSRKRLLTVELEDGLKFLLHSFCEVIQRGRSWSTEVTSQEIRAMTITHSDQSAECTQAFLYYSLDALVHVNRVPMFLEGLPMKYQGVPALPEHRLSAEEHQTRARRYRLVTRLPASHTFHGQIWGPANTRALYTVYFSRQGTYNPFSEGGFWLLRDGGPWEVTL
ncbi:MAG TPA: hypothetical protein VGX03_03545 [Candidatus Binatia bacterium]|jgi:hypothetical protein|nr:hypothetical protein [Candidatus Binatia bacterium]